MKIRKTSVRRRRRTGYDQSYRERDRQKRPINKTPVNEFQWELTVIAASILADPLPVFTLLGAITLGRGDSLPWGCVSYGSPRMSRHHKLSSLSRRQRTLEGVLMPPREDTIAHSVLFA